MDVLLTAGGTKRLQRRMAELGVEVRGPFGAKEELRIAQQIQSLPTEVKVVVGGSSLGANAAPRIGAMVCPREIDLMFGIQPSLWARRKGRVTANVKRAVYFYVPWYWPVTFGLGQYRWKRQEGNTVTTLVEWPTYMTHPGNNVESVQGRILAELRRLVAG